MTGFDKLIDLVIGQINDLIPWRFVYQYHNGAKYRGGKFVKIVKPGIHWKWSWLEKIYTDTVTDTTLLLPTQSIFCKDNEIVIRGCIGYKIADIGKWFNNVSDTKSALSDIGKRILKNICYTLTLEQLKANLIVIKRKKLSFDEVILELLQREVENYGIKINFFSLIEISRARSYKVWNENPDLQ